MDMEALAEYHKDDMVLRVLPDDCLESPREHDNLGWMVCWHRRYALGDEQPKDDPEDYYAENIPHGSVVLPLYLIDHGMVGMNTTGFGYCDPHGWDWGQVGWIYVTPERMKEEELDTEKARRILKAEVQEYDQFLRGDVYGFILERVHECQSCGQEVRELIDSCWGFYDLQHLFEVAGVDVEGDGWARTEGGL